jgi:hypothetical protein
VNKAGVDDMLASQKDFGSSSSLSLPFPSLYTGCVKKVFPHGWSNSAILQRNEYNQRLGQLGGA